MIQGIFYKEFQILNLGIRFPDITYCCYIPKNYNIKVLWQLIFYFSKHICSIYKFRFSYIPIQYILSFTMKSGSFSYMMSTILSFIALFVTYITYDWIFVQVLQETPPKHISIFKIVALKILHCYPIIYLYKILLKLLNSKLRFPVDRGKLL